MRTWQIVVAVLLLLPHPISRAERPRWQDGVIIQRTDRGYLYLFPATQGRIKGNANPAGVINVGETITVMYSLRLIGRARTRFIGVDATLSPGVSPRLKVTKAMRAFGFFVRDTNQATLDITIERSFMRKLEKATTEQSHNAVATQGNLNVSLKKQDGKVVISGVTLD